MIETKSEISIPELQRFERDVSLSICFLGGFRLEVAGKQIDGVPLPAQLLLLRLATSQGSVSRKSLGPLLWPDATLERASFYLRRTLSQLRALLGAERRRLGEDRYQNLTLDLSDSWCDLTAFMRLSKSSELRDLRLAVDMYSGPVFERSAELWVEVEREAVRTQFVKALLKLAEGSEALGDEAEARSYILRALHEKPLDEALLRAHMRLLAKSGQLTELSRTFESASRRFETSLGIRLSSETRRVYADLLKTTVSHGQTETVPRRLPSIPRRTTAIFGRQDDLERIEELLSTNRSIVLTGLPGVGKSRVAEAVACRYADELAWRVVWISSSGPTISASLLQTIAELLGASEDVDVATLATVIREQSSLFVIDSNDHPFSDPDNILGQITSLCQSSRVIRCARNVEAGRGEAIYSLKPLDYGTLPEHVMSTPAGEMFASRVRLSRPTMSFSSAEAGDIFALLRSIDGLPQAIEIVAAQTRSLTIRQIASQFAGESSIPNSLRDLLRSSLSLLNQQEAELFQSLGIFDGPWSFPEGFGVCANTLSQAEFASLLGRLVDFSLVSMPNEGLYELLQLHRSEARSRQIERPSNFQAVRERFLRYYEGLNPADPEQLVQIERSIERVVALACASGSEVDLASAATTLSACFDSWQRQGKIHQFYRLAKLLFQAWGPSQDDRRANLVVKLAGAAHALYRFEEARVLLTEARGLVQSGDTRPLSAMFLLTFGDLAASQGRMQEAKEFLSEAHKAFGQLGDVINGARCLASLGYVAREQGDYEAAKSLTEESLTRFIELEDDDWIVWCIGSLAVVHLEIGDTSRAESYLKQALDRHLATGNREGEAWNRTMLGAVYLRSQRLDEAIEQLNCAIDIHGAQEASLGKSWPLELLGEARTNAGDYEGAIAALEEARKLQSMVGSSKVSGHTYLHLCLVNFLMGNQETARSYFALAERSLAETESAVLRNHYEKVKHETGYS